MLSPSLEIASAALPSRSPSCRIKNSVFSSFAETPIRLFADANRTLKHASRSKCWRLVMVIGYCLARGKQSVASPHPMLPSYVSRGKGDLGSTFLHKPQAYGDVLDR